MTTNTNPGCLSSIFSIFKPKKSAQTVFPYRLRNEFLSPAEFSFYKILENITKEKLTIQCKVRLSDIFYVSKPNENKGYFNRINQKHLDYLLCDPKNMRPIIGIELDDSSHDRPSRQDRDIFVDEVFKTAKLPLLHISAKQTYNPQDIFNQIKDAIIKAKPENS